MNLGLPNFEKLAGSNCARAGCLATAAYVPLVRLYAPKYVKNSHVPAEMAFALPLCANCANETRIEHLIDDKTWNGLIVPTFQRGGFIPPDRRRTELAWLPLSPILTPAIGH